MVITLPNRDLAAIIQRRENCSRAEPQNNSLTGTSPTRDALVSDECDDVREPMGRSPIVGLAAARLEFAGHRASIQVLDPTSLTVPLHTATFSRSCMRGPRRPSYTS